MALGEQLGEFRGKTTTTRVLPGDDYRYIKMEVSWQESGTLLGMPAQNKGTIEVFERVTGQGYGSGQGIAFCEAGGVIWNSMGITTEMGEGMSGRTAFAIACQAPTDGPLARLNGVMVIGEQTTDTEGNVHTTLWEWK
jgi:hypothetical protein